MRLPDGFAARLADGLLADDDVLVGGAPLTAVRLNARARKLLGTGRMSVTDEASSQLVRRLLASDLAYPDLSGVASVGSTDLTVVVPVRDRATQLDRTLRALAGLRCIVVDDASYEPRPIRAVCDRHGATLLRLDRNVGPAGARNHGFTQVTTEFVAFVDSDVEVAAQDLLRLSRHFVDPMVALVGPDIRGRSYHAHPRWFERYDEIVSPLTVGRAPSSVRPGARVAWLPGACLVARTSALAGGFDPGMRLGEDVDLVWRIVAAGRTVRYDPTVVAGHESRADARAWVVRLFEYGTSAAPLARRHGSAVAPAVLGPTLAVAGAAVLLRRRWGAAVAGASLLRAAIQVRHALPESPRRNQIAIGIGARAVGWAVRQEAGLLLRHWWPLAMPVAVIAKPVRRAVATALVVDAAVAIQEGRGRSAALVVAGRRVSDLAYGAGLWYGCWRERSARALCPRRSVT